MPPTANKLCYLEGLTFYILKLFSGNLIFFKLTSLSVLRVETLLFDSDMFCTVITLHLGG